MPLSLNLKKCLLNSDHYYLGVSGGVDSMVLLDLFIKGNLPFTVLHFKHNWRDSSPEINLLLSLSKQYKFPLLIGNGLPVRKTEEEARNQRWEFFKSHVKNNSSLVLAHQLEDNVETVLMQLCRGTKTAFGIKPSSQIFNIHCIRPLLDISKDQLVEYATEHSLKWFEDYTNSDLSIRRNFCRNKILPLLKELNSNALENISKFSNSQIKTAEENEQNLSHIYNSSFIDLTKFWKLKENEQLLVLNYWLKNQHIENLTAYHISKSNEVANKLTLRHNLPGNKILCRREKKLFIKK